MFTGEFLLHTTIKKVGHVRILLSLGHAVVTHTYTTPDFSEYIAMVARRKRYGKIEGLVVQCETNKYDPWAIGNRKLIEVRHNQSPGKLSRAVRTKIEKDHRITILNRRYRLGVLIGNHDRIDKFIVEPNFVRMLYRGY